MSDLVAFLRARFAEREATAKAAQTDCPAWADAGVVAREGVAFSAVAVGEHIALNDPAYVLADIEAKRRILDEHHPIDPCDAHDASLRSITCETVRLLALPYADRPGYRDEWRP